jgi:hypothetical protein
MDEAILSAVTVVMNTVQIIALAYIAVLAARQDRK